MNENVIPPSKDAKFEILSILNEIMIMGANDSERSQIDNILERLTAHQINPEDAIKEARKIKDSKQSYH